jgi:hypothetical protein
MSNEAKIERLEQLLGPNQDLPILPHAAFEVITPDEVAECWNGVFGTGDLYEQLWGCVNDYEKIDREDCGPYDVIGVNSVAKFWDRFSDEHKAKLNELAVQNDNWGFIDG